MIELCLSAVESGAVNRVGQQGGGQSNGETGRDPLRINSGEAPGQAEMNAMSGGTGGHMMSPGGPGQDHLVRHHGPQDTGGDMRQAGAESR